MSDAPATFLFADIAGFTALTEAYGDEEAVAVVDAFCAAVDVALPAGGSRVKSIGDAVMLRVPDPGDAILLGLRMTRDLLWRERHVWRESRSPSWNRRRTGRGLFRCHGEPRRTSPRLRPGARC